MRANQLRDRTLQIYVQAADHALTKGIIIADTKFEFGIDPDGNLVLADEIFTPDSSRYWPADELPGRRGSEQLRQAVRPQLAHQPRVRLGPRRRRSRRHRCRDDIIDATRDRYINAYERISGLSFGDWIGPGA